MEGSTELPTPGGKLRNEFTSQIQEKGMDPLWVWDPWATLSSLLNLPKPNSQGTWKASESGHALREQGTLFLPFLMQCLGWDERSNSPGPGTKALFSSVFSLSLTAHQQAESRFSPLDVEKTQGRAFQSHLF